MGFQTADTAKRSLYKAEICHGSSGAGCRGAGLAAQPVLPGTPVLPVCAPRARSRRRAPPPTGWRFDRSLKDPAPSTGKGCPRRVPPALSRSSHRPERVQGRGRRRVVARPPRHGHGALGDRGGRARPAPRSPVGRSRGQAGSGPCLQVPGRPESARTRLPRPAAPDSRERGAPGLSASLEPAGRGRAAPDLGGPIASQVQALAPRALCKCLRI